MNVKKGDIIMITVPEGVEHAAGALLIVDEVKSWGVEAHMNIPYKGEAFFSKEHGTFKVVGEVVLSTQAD